MCLCYAYPQPQPASLNAARIHIYLRSESHAHRWEKTIECLGLDAGITARALLPTYLVFLPQTANDNNGLCGGLYLSGA